MNEELSLQQCPGCKLFAQTFWTNMAEPNVVITRSDIISVDIRRPNVNSSQRLRITFRCRCCGRNWTCQFYDGELIPVSKERIE